MSGSSTGESVGLISRRFWVRVPAGLVGKLLNLLACTSVDSANNS